MSKPEQQKQQERWRRSPKLPEEVFTAWQKSGGELNPSSVVATIDEDGAPRTAPFGSLRAITPSLLRLLIHRYHDTLTNIKRDGRVMVVLIAPPNVAVSVQGRARVVSEPWEADERYALVEIDVIEVKNDMPVKIDIESGIMISPTGPFQQWWESVSNQLL